MNRKRLLQTRFLTSFMLFSAFFLILIDNSHDNNSLSGNITRNEPINIKDELKINNVAKFADVNLTNAIEVNNTWVSHNRTICIKGNLYNKTPPIPPRKYLSGYNVSIKINGTYDHSYNATTDVSGKFEINYTIPFSFDVYKSYKIQVNVTDNVSSDGSIDVINYYIIHINSNSSLSINWGSTSNVTRPWLTGENFRVAGSLKYDNNTGISNVNVRSGWYNESFIANDTIATDSSGTFSQDVTIPETTSSSLKLQLNYSNTPHVNFTEFNISSIRVFSEFTCTWTVPNQVSEGDVINVNGRIFSQTNTSLNISDRNIVIKFAGAPVTPIPITTGSNGEFSFTYTIPDGDGLKSFTIDLLNTAGKSKTHSKTLTVIDVPAAAGPLLPATTPPPPFLMFFIILIPIVIGIIGVLVFVGIRFLKKQEEESRSVEIPLEGKINNLKILKDTGRIEEALSYLFNAIYMELIKAKFNRSRQPHETIRDLAIVSVKELKLNAAMIYAFITKIEKMIYGPPLSISDRQFYDTVALFSPIYFDLTGFNFILSKTF